MALTPILQHPLQPELDIEGTGSLRMQQQLISKQSVESNLCRGLQNLGVVLLKLGHVPESLAAFGQTSHYRQNSGEELRQGLKEMGFQL